MKKFEQIFKILAVTALLYILYCYSQNGRYFYIYRGRGIFDTQTGNLYQADIDNLRYLGGGLVNPPKKKLK